MRRVLVLGVIAVLAAPLLAAAQDRPPDAQRRRDQIQLMEGVLTRAVRLGAERLNRQMQAMDPTLTVLTGQARARGFVLEGYGVFFDVEVPSLSASAVWSMMTVQQDAQMIAALDSVRRALAGLPEGPGVEEARRGFQRLARTVSPAQTARVTGVETQAPVPNTVAAASAPDPLAVVEDPGSLYTESVKASLIDAMLEHSLPMDLAPDEWLTVAARQSEGPLAPSEIYEASTIILRVKGEDLAVYAADRSRRAEVRQKVDVRIY